MVWRIMQLALCVIIWSILISVALFKLSPVIGSTSTPVAAQPVEPDTEFVKASKNKCESSERDKESRSKNILTEKFTSMIWRTSDYSKPAKYTKNKLMNLLQDLSAAGELAIQQVMKLISAELGIVKTLLHNTNPHLMQQAVDKRDALVDISLPIATEVYDMILNLAATDNGGKESMARTPFLCNMMERLEQYYLIIKTMRNTSKTVRQ